VKVPVGAIWKVRALNTSVFATIALTLLTSVIKFLPWNKGRTASCSVVVRYCDEDFRIVEDKSGDLFVYSRPVVSRNLEI
jgi:hypothetical protein